MSGGANVETPLNKAIENSNLDLVDSLLKSGADVNQPGLYGEIPLTNAFRFYANNEITKLIILRLLDEPSIIIDKRSVFHALDTGDVEILDKILSKNSSYINDPLYMGTTLLHYAAKDGAKKIVEVLLAHGADVNQAEAKGLTPLDLAASGPEVKRNEIIDILVEKGANKFKGKEYNQTFLHFAARTGNKKLVDSLLAGGADVNKADDLGFTPLMAAASTCGGSCGQIIDALLAAGADKRVTIPETGMTAAHYFILNGGSPRDPLFMLLSMRMEDYDNIIYPDFSEIPFLGAKPPVVPAGEKPIFTFIGHGGEHMGEIGKNDDFCMNVGTCKRVKMKKDFILFTTEECGILGLFEEQSKKAVRYGSVNTSEKKELFKNLYSTNKIVAGEAKNEIQKAMGTSKLHMYRENDEFPRISFTLDAKYMYKSGLYLNPLKEDEFLQKRTDGSENFSFKAINSDEAYFKDSLFPTQEGVEKLRKILMPLLDRSLITVMNEIINKFSYNHLNNIMDKFGPGVYIFPACRYLLNPSFLLPAENSKIPFHTNFLERVHLYNSLPNTNDEFKSKLAHFRTHVPRIRRNSIVQQSQYNTTAPAPSATGGGGSERPVAPTPNIPVEEPWTIVESRRMRRMRRDKTKRKKNSRKPKSFYPGPPYIAPPLAAAGSAGATGRFRKKVRVTRKQRKN